MEWLGVEQDPHPKGLRTPTWVLFRKALPRHECRDILLWRRPLRLTFARLKRAAATPRLRKVDRLDEAGPLTCGLRGEDLLYAQSVAPETSLPEPRSRPKASSEAHRGPIEGREPLDCTGVAAAT